MLKRLLASTELAARETLKAHGWVHDPLARTWDATDGRSLPDTVLADLDALIDTFFSEPPSVLAPSVPIRWPPYISRVGRKWTPEQCKAASQRMLAIHAKKRLEAHAN